MDTTLVVLIVICLATAGVLAWLLRRQGEPLLPPGLISALRRPTAPQRPLPTAAPDTAATPLARRVPPAPLDQHDPTVRRYEEVQALTAQAAAAARAVPESFEDRAAMRVELLAVEQHLEQIRDALSTADVTAREAQFPLLERLAGRLASIRRDTEAITASLEHLAEQEQQLTAEALALGDDLAALERENPYPRATVSIAATGDDLIARVRQIPPRAAIGSFNALKYRRREAEELLADVLRCRERLTTILDPHQATLLALLTSSIEGETTSPPPRPAAKHSAVPPPAPAATDSAEAAALERRLLRMAMGDRGKVTSLIALEQASAPGAPRVALLRSAIERWERDLR